MHSKLSGPTKAVCYREVFTIRGGCSTVMLKTTMLLTVIQTFLGFLSG